MTQVTVYTKENCMQCLMTKRFLANQGVVFNEINAEKDDKARENLVNQGIHSLPAVFMGEKLVCTGFSIPQLKATFDKE